MYWRGSEHSSFIGSLQFIEDNFRSSNWSPQTLHRCPTLIPLRRVDCSIEERKRCRLTDTQVFSIPIPVCSHLSLPSRQFFHSQHHSIVHCPLPFGRMSFPGEIPIASTLTSWSTIPWMNGQLILNCNYAFKILDRNNSGTISFDEFMSAISLTLPGDIENQLALVRVYSFLADWILLIFSILLPKDVSNVCLSWTRTRQ